MPSLPSFDVAIVGAGICGLAHAQRPPGEGKRVVVVDRDRQSNGASIRNFGFVTVTGQRPANAGGARRSRDVWAEVAEAAGIAVVQRGLLMIARRPFGRDVTQTGPGNGSRGARGTRWVARSHRQ